MISKNSLRNLVARALASAFRRTDKRLKRRNSRTEQLETRALLAVFTVTSTADIAAAGTLRHAIDQANSTPGDDEIRFDVATIGTEFDLTLNQFPITESLTITGNGPGNTVIDAQLNSRIFEISFSAVNVTISGVTLKNGLVAGAGTQRGGAIQSLAPGILSISSSVLSDNTVEDTTGTDAYGGAVSVQGGNLTVFGSTISGNTADWGGAIYAAGDSHVAITSSNVDGNIASNDGGAIYAGFGGQGDVTITSSTLENNQSQRRGGAIKADNVTIIGGSSVRLNSATTEGGAIHADGNVTVTNSRIEDNTATTHGGAIHAGGNVMVTGISTMSDNTANGDGGAIFSIGSTEVTNSTLANNSTTGDNHRGGAIHSDSGAVTISQSTLSGNSTAGSNAEGGAIFAHSGAVSISQSTLSGNSTAGSSADGGAIYADSGAVSISQSTLSGNSTAGGSAEGGAIYAYSGAVSISQSTLSGNSTAGTGAQGGAIYANNGAVSISQSTLTLNNAAQSLGGAIYSYSSPVTIRNSIVAGNTDNGTAPDVRKSLAVGDAFTVTNSLIGRNNGTGLTATGTTPGANGNLIGGDNAGAAINPLLAPLANNGGPTQTHALLATSPAINKGSNALAVDAANGSSPLTTDQRGNPFVRIFDTTVDMGAYEFFTGPLVVSTTMDESDGNFSSGDLSLREAIELANSSPETNSITFATSTNGTEFELSLFEMFVTDTLTITGNGAANTVIDAQQASRIFNFSSGDFTLNGVTLKNGKTTADGNGGGGGAIAASSSGLLTVQNSTVSGNSTAGSTARGGAIFAISGAVTISQSTLSGNSTAGLYADGGAIYANTGAVSISQSTLSGNSTAGSDADGGAIYANTGAVSISQSTLSGNSTTGANAEGGAIFAYSGTVTISQSTLSGNFTSGASSFGGAISSPNSGDITITNSTLSGNQVFGTGDFGGGAIYFDDGSVTITNSTLTGNSANIAGAIGINADDAGESLTIRNSIVAGNTADTNPDFTAPGNPGTNLVVDHSLIGRNDGTSLTATGTTPGANGNLIGGNNSGAAINPQLAPLANNGGPTLTHALLSNSPAINKGSNALVAGVTTDQRGNPFARIFDPTVDMGAYERQTLAASFFVVTTTSDELNYSNGVVSLREAIANANGSVGSNTITFATSTNGTEFDLSLGEMFVTDTLTINGNGANNTIIDAQQLSRIFNFQSGDFTLNGVTLKNGRTIANRDGGGAIDSSSSGLLAIQNSTLSGNSTAGNFADGGAIYTYSGAVTISQSTLSGNSTAGSDAAGGAIYTNTGAVSISQSTLTLNDSDQGDGGAISSISAPVTILNSIVAGNTDNGTAPDVHKSPNSDDVFIVINSLIGRNNGTGLTASANPDANGNLIGGTTDPTKINPLLAPLANNGGPTRTHALLTNSPAFDRGSNALAVNVSNANSPLTTDQRGSNFLRIVAGTVDMGAIETRTPDGTTGADAFVLTYLSTSTSGSVVVTVSTDGGPVVNLGTFPMNLPLIINGLGGTDSVRIVGTTGADTFTVNTSTGLIINGSSLTLTSIENRALAGGLGNDVYKFDVDSALGLWRLDEAGGGLDTIDFSPTTTVGVSINLGKISAHVVHATNLNLTLGLATAFENAIGGAGADTLIGNSLPNTLIGGAGNDKLTGAAGSDNLFGGLDNDTYVFAATSAAEADQIHEKANEGLDTLDFSAMTTNVIVSLGTSNVQTVHLNRTVKLNTSSTFENLVGGRANDTLTGNSVANTLIGGAGNDSLTGAAGSDILFGGLNNDTYLFAAATATEADQVHEKVNEGTDTLNFAAMTTGVVVSLGTSSVQNVHTNRTLKLSTSTTVENLTGGNGADTLFGNTVANRLIGGNGNNILVGSDGADILEAGTGRDILIGGLGLDTLTGGSGDDILIAGRTTNDTSAANLNTLRTAWISASPYATRVTNLRAGVGSPLVSLKAKVNVLNDAGEDDILTGGANSDWYFRAVDDAITDLFAGELIDVL